MKFEEPKVVAAELDFAEKLTVSECESPHDGAEDRCSGY